ncbi:hypothetical protein CRUP_017412, partial [Coryphaenoides rupestris]
MFSPRSVEEEVYPLDYINQRAMPPPPVTTTATTTTTTYVMAIHRNLWVSGLSSTTRATDLKTLFSKHGKVVGAKMVTNAKSPGARCYGF